ncbi:MAG: long-chain fatty acid--CoA ligase [Gemmatimonadales bacterium]|nr:MAG: long-chain fatty acid--CoA ligase [Gemmatimonadales bacterium]
MNAVELFLERVSRSGPTVALRTFPEGATLTWDAWARQSAALASRLQAAGVRPGDRVAIWAGNRPLWPMGDLAALIAGAVPVGIYPSSAPVQVESLLADSGAVVALADTPERIRLLEDMRARLPSLAAIMGEADLGEAELGEAVHWTDRSRWPGLGVDPEADAILIYTSGSTGTPRGARISHRCLLASAASIRDTLGLVEGDVALSFLPYAHAAERIFGLYTRILTGMEGVLVEDHRQVWDAARAVHPTVFGGLPRFFEKVAEALCADAVGGAVAGGGDGAPARDREAAPAADTTRFFGRRLRVATSGGATLVPSVSETLAEAGVTVLGAYGLTEHLCATMNRPDHHNLETSGPPMPGTELRIAGDGEILIRRGPLTFSGYLNREAETEATFTPDGKWLLTGDLGELDARGFLRVTGRKKELLALSTGKKIAPVPIEASLVRDPWIDQAVLVGEGRKYVSALLVPSRPALEDWARRERIDAPWPALLRHPRVEARVAEIVASTNSELSRTEQVRRYHLLSEPLSQESGELTPTLKVRRGRVLERHAAEVAALYPDALHQAEAMPHPHGDPQ